MLLTWCSRQVTFICCWLEFGGLLSLSCWLEVWGKLLLYVADLIWRCITLYVASMLFEVLLLSVADMKFEVNYFYMLLTWGLRYIEFISCWIELGGLLPCMLLTWGWHFSPCWSGCTSFWQRRYDGTPLTSSSCRGRCCGICPWCPHGHMGVQTRR